MEGGDRGMPETIDLLVHRGHHRWMAVAQVRDPDAAAEVQHIATVDRVQMRTLGGLDDQVRVSVVRGRDQLGVALAPRRGIRGSQHAAHDPEVAVAGPDGDAAALRTPTFPRARKPPNMIAIPAASYAPRTSRLAMPTVLAAEKPTAMISAPAVSSMLQITRSMPAR